MCVFARDNCFTLARPSTTAEHLLDIVLAVISAAQRLSEQWSDKQLQLWLIRAYVTLIFVNACTLQ